MNDFEEDKSVSDIHNCYGCGVCAVICPKSIVEINLNSDGFYEPVISDSSKCTNCGLCKDVCAYSHEELSLNNPIINSYAGWSKDDNVRRKCSSGGVGFELGRSLINDGFKVCGVKYNPQTNRAEHYIASTLEELIPSIGSKYIQSYTVDGFKSINKKEKYLVTGTPCQIDSFRRYIRKFRCEDNFVLMDFFCHGVPSKLMWNKYVKWAESKVGKLTYVSWRNKFTGWHDSWAMAIDGEQNGESINWHDSYNLLIKEKKSFLNSRLSQNDMFYRLFLSDSCLGKACYDRCKYKYDKSSADIRIGDAWGSLFKYDEKGVSTVIAFTKKGDDLLHRCNCELKLYEINDVAEGQMKTCPIRPNYYNILVGKLRDNNFSIGDAYNILIISKKKARNIQRIKHPLRTIINFIKIIIQ